MKRIVKGLVLCLMAGTISAQAEGTLAGTDINNTVTLSYKVGGVDQTQISSNTETFKVDRKIDLIVDATNTPLDVPPGAQQQSLSFLIVNEGNDHEWFDLTGTYDVPGDQFDPLECNITDSAGGGTTIDHVELDADKNITVYVTCNIPAVPDVQADDNGTVSLLAETNRTEDTGVDDPDVVQNVFADGNGTDDQNESGDFSDRGTYHIISADLNASKDSCVVSDPINDDNNPKRIPGATVRYVIEVENNGNSDADEVTTTDQIQSDLDIVSAEILEGACDCQSPTGNSAGTATIDSQNSEVELDFGTVAAGTTECAYITVEVK